MRRSGIEMKKRILAIILCIVMVLPFVACNMDRNLPEESQRFEDEIRTETQICWSEVPLDSEKAMIAVSDFAARLLQTESVVAGGTEGDGMNRLLSPISVLNAVVMTSNGAENETREQMEKTFGISIEYLNEYLSSYQKSLPRNGVNRLHMANSIWFTEDDRFTVNEEFLNTNDTYYGADIYERAFDDTTVYEINRWVSEHTDGLIKEIINEIPKDAVMYLINALVFDAKWEETYEESDIREGVFTTFDGIEQEIDLMFSSENLYLEDEKATGFMKYYEGRDYAFIALLPNEGITLTDYVNTLTGEKLQQLLSHPVEVKTHAWLPQFTVEYQSELKDTLIEMGIKDAFSGRKADLSGIGTSTNGNLFVDRVIHKTYIEVSPVGTKAGAATAVEIKDECAVIEPKEIKEVRLDRPFLYMIIDCKYNQPIFIGTINYIHPYRCGMVDDVCGYPTTEDFK